MWNTIGYCRRSCSYLRKQTVQCDCFILLLYKYVVFAALQLIFTLAILAINSNFSRISAENYNVSRKLAGYWNSRQNPANSNISRIYVSWFLVPSSWFLVPSSSGVEDALGDTNPPASPVLHCLLYLVPSDTYLLEVLAITPLQFWRLQAFFWNHRVPNDELVVGSCDIPCVKDDLWPNINWWERYLHGLSLWQVWRF